MAAAVTVLNQGGNAEFGRDAVNYVLVAVTFCRIDMRSVSLENEVKRLVE